MKHELVYSAPAENELAEVWLTSKDRNAVSRSIEVLERLLKADPLRTGKPRLSNLQRMAGHGVIDVFYEVIPDDAKVIVQGVFTVE